MKITFSFFESKLSVKPIKAPQTLSIPEVFFNPMKPNACGQIEWGGGDTVYVEAGLDEITTDLTSFRFQIKLGYHPDCAPVTNENGVFVDEDGQRRLQLLRGADGLSYLRLLRKEVKDDNSIVEEIARYAIAVKPEENKSLAMRRMVDDLLREDSSLALSVFEGLSLTKIERKWNPGDASSEEWDLQIKCEEIESLLKRLSPHLEWIRKNCATKLVRIHTQLPQHCIKRFSTKTLRDIARFGTDNASAHYFSPSLKTSHDIPIHGGINDFFLTLRHDAHAMLDCVETKIHDLETTTIPITKIPKTKNEKNKPDKTKKGKDDDWEEDEWFREDIQDQISFFTLFKQRLAKIKKRCSEFLSVYYPWAQCNRRDISSIPVSSIPDVQAYKTVFLLIQEYRKKRFIKRFFMDAALNGRLRVPEYVRQDDDEIPSVWQKNYSYIYECWVFSRLVQAFEQEGFHGLEASYQKQIRRRILNLCLGPSNNEPIHAETRNGDLQLDLFHGVVAYRADARLSDPYPEFRSLSRKETPDFVIVFSTKKDFRWMVLDAKSPEVLLKKSVESRDKYLKLVRRYDEEIPEQSWLIYSGHFFDSSGIEFNPVTKQSSWDRKFKESPLLENHLMRWDSKLGIVNWDNKSALRPVGHIRANILSLKEDDDPFIEFARGQIATAKRQLGLDNVTRPNVQHSFCRI